MSDRARQVVLAVSVPLLLLVGVELALRLFASSAFGPRPMFTRVERDGREMWQRLPTRNLPWYPPYARSKPAGTLRVACIGGSTVEGNPFFESAFPRVLERRLSAALAPRPVEVMGCGIGGQYSDGELAVLREVLDFQPDLVVLYSCHNEFHPMNVATVLEEAEHPWRSGARRLLARTALGRALLGAAAGERRPAPTVADQPPVSRPIDGPEFRLVLERFQRNLATFVDLCRERSVPLVLCTVAGNLRDFPPMADVFSSSTSEADRERVRALLEQARLATDSGDGARALSLLDEATAIDDHPASIDFQRGRALLALGRPAEALARFVRARDEDGRCNRAVTGTNEAVRAFAGQPGVYVADIEAQFAATAPDGIIGGEVIVDNVHPTVQGQARIADGILQTLAAASVLIDSQGLARALDPVADGPAHAPVDGDDVARIGLNNLRLGLEKGRFEATSSLALLQLQRAHELLPARADVMVGLGLLAGLRGEGESARSWFSQARVADPSAFTAWAQYARESALVRQLFACGDIRFEQDAAVTGR